jgi:hypothetical protein
MRKVSEKQIVQAGHNDDIDHFIDENAGHKIVGRKDVE